MASTNDITGDKLQTKSVTTSYIEGWERIFGEKPSKQVERDMEKIHNELMAEIELGSEQ